MGRQQVSKVSKGQRPLPLLWVACWMGSTDQILRLMNIESLAILEYLRPNLLLAWAPSKSPGEESRSRIDRRRWARLKSGTSFTVRSRPSSLPPACAGQGRRDSLGTPRSDSAVAHHRPLAVRQATIPLPSPLSSVNPLFEKSSLLQQSNYLHCPHKIEAETARRRTNKDGGFEFYNRVG